MKGAREGKKKRLASTRKRKLSEEKVIQKRVGKKEDKEGSRSVEAREDGEKRGKQKKKEQEIEGKSG